MKKSKLLSLMTCAAVLSTSFAFIATPAVKAAAPVELKWYVIGNGQPTDQAKVEKKVNEYLKKKGLNATLKLTTFDWGSYDKKLSTMIAAGENFDICFTSNWANNYQQQAVKGAFLPLDNYFKKELKGTAKLLGPDFMKGAKIDGKIYAIQANKEKAHQWGLILRSDIVKKYKFNIKSIKKLEDLEPMLKVIKAKEPNMYGLESVRDESPFKILDFDRVGDDGYPGVVDNFTKNYKVYNEIASPQAMKYFKTMRKFYQAGYIRQDAATLSDFNADEMNGKMFAACKQLKPGKDAEMTNSTKHPWVQVELTQPIISNRETTGSMQAISRTSKHPQIAAKFLELFNTDKYLNNLINYGIEGVHYTKVKGESNVIELTASNAKSNAYNPGAGWMFGNQFINYTLKSEDKNKWKKFLAFNNAAKKTNTLGFVFDPSKVKTQIASCANVWQKYVYALEAGAVDPTVYVPKALAEFKAAGSEKIIAEKQKQLNAWVKKNK